MALGCIVAMIRLNKLGVLVFELGVAKGVVDNKRCPVFIFQGQSAMTDAFVATRDGGCRGMIVL